MIITSACAAGGGAEEFAQIQVALLQNAMLVAGIVTLVQLFSVGPIGGQVPIIMGTSSGFIGVFQSVNQIMGGGILSYGAIMGASIVGGLFETVLGVQLYARERDDHARLFDAVCAAVSSLPCALRSVKRSETTYSAALSCLVTLCTVQAATGAADNARAAVMIGDKVFTADAVKISHEAKVKRYYAIGEENPYAAVAGKAVYTIVLHGFSGGEEALPGEFTLQTGGARYTHCVLKAASKNKLVIEAGACEKITQRTQSGTEA